MSKNNFPNKISIFPLSNAVFFPNTMLPLNIFEDRYIQLVKDCMKEEKMFGMVQPRYDAKNSNKPEVYKVGCLGKIISFNETADKRFVITLSGIIRFKITEELENKKLYRKFNVDYSDFLNDLENKNLKTDSGNNLFKKIKIFFEKANYSVEYNELIKLDFEQLINTVCMISPFSIREKQRLIECVNINEKMKVLDEIISTNIFDLEENKTIQ
jgi:Lon protease-like protein